MFEVIFYGSLEPFGRKCISSLFHPSQTVLKLGIRYSDCHQISNLHRANTDTERATLGEERKPKTESGRRETDWETTVTISELTNVRAIDFSSLT